MEMETEPLTVWYISKHPDVLLRACARSPIDLIPDFIRVPGAVPTISDLRM